jgi:hypothetical protein
MSIAERGYGTEDITESQAGSTSSIVEWRYDCNRFTRSAISTTRSGANWREREGQGSAYGQGRRKADASSVTSNQIAGSNQRGRPRRSVKKCEERQTAVSVSGKATSRKQSGKNRTGVQTSEMVGCIKIGRATSHSIAAGRRHMQVYGRRMQVPTDFTKFALEWRVTQDEAVSRVRSTSEKVKSR